MYLYQAILQVLEDNGNQIMTIGDIADQINKKGLYTKKNGNPADSWGVGTRAVNDAVFGNPPYFEVFIKKQ